MAHSSSPPVLYLDDDDDDDDRHMSRTSSSTAAAAAVSNDMRLPRKKRKLTDSTVRVNPSLVNWPKRQRNDQYHRHPSQGVIDSEPDLEPILLDPDEYIIEESDPHSFCSFDWTIQTRPSSPPPLSLRPPPLIPTRIPSHPIQTPPRTSAVPPPNPNYAAMRYSDQPDGAPIINQRDKLIPQLRQPIAVPAPRPALPLPLPKPTSSLVRPAARRGRPLKNSRVLYTPSTSPPAPARHRSEPHIFAPAQSSPRLPSSSSTATAASPAPMSSSSHSTSEIRRQILNGTGLFSAFHDSKYYQCNICKFKSVTSSTLLQHLFTHMFFCEQCSFYTYSHYSLAQHVFDKHSPPASELPHDPLNPRSFDLLYVTRCADGTFALCMDSSLAPVSNRDASVDQRLIISSATPNDQLQIKPAKKKSIKPKATTNETNNDIVLLSADLRDTTHRSVISTKAKEKPSQSYVFIKHRRSYSLKKPFSLHALILEYDICRENMIRLMSNTQDTLKRRKMLREFRKTRLIDEVANCLRTVVNDVVDSEDNSVRSSLICTLPNQILSSIFCTDNLGTIMSLLQLNNKYEQSLEQKTLYDREHAVRESPKHVFALSSPETNQSEQTITASLHSSMTNGDSIFTQTKIHKSPATGSNAQQHTKKNPSTSSQANSAKSTVAKKTNTTPPTPAPSSPNTVAFRPVVPKPLRPLPNPSLPAIIDRNNNSISPTHSTLPPSKVPNIIVLD